MFEIQYHIRHFFLFMLLSMFNAESSAEQVDKKGVSDKTRDEIIKKIDLGADWELRSIIKYSSSKPEIIVKSIDIKDEITGKCFKTDIELSSDTKKLPSPFGIHVTYCYTDDSTCLTWIFIKNKDGHWIADKTFEIY